MNMCTMLFDESNATTRTLIDGRATVLIDLPGRATTLWKQQATLSKCYKVGSCFDIVVGVDGA